MDVFRPVACPMSWCRWGGGVARGKSGCGCHPAGPQQPSSQSGTDPVVPGAGEVLAELVEGRRHDAVGRVERLLDACSRGGEGGYRWATRSEEAAAAETLRRLTVAVVNVDINVEHALVHPAGSVGREHRINEVGHAGARDSVSSSL